MIGGCTEQQAEAKYKVATGDGALRAHLDSIRERLSYNRSNEGQFQRFELDSLDRHNFNSEYPYWQELVVFSSDEGLRMAVVKGSNEGRKNLEEFHFGEDGELEYALVREQKQGDSTQNEYFFILEKLVLAKEEEKELNLEDDSVKFKSILLVKEADRLKEISAKKSLKT